jgi:hypothetical protein
MDMLGRLLLRLILVPLAAAVAVTVAAAFVIVAHWNALQAVLHAHPEAQEDYVIALLVGGPLLAVLLSSWVLHTFMLASIGVLIAEGFAIRSWIFHAANGGLSGWLGWTLTQDIGDTYRLLTDPTILVAAGLAAGFAYWAVAGSTAGFWKPIQSRRPDRP